MCWSTGVAVQVVPRQEVGPLAVRLGLDAAACAERLGEVVRPVLELLFDQVRHDLGVSFGFQHNPGLF